MVPDGMGVQDAQDAEIMVDRLGKAIARGEVTPAPGELEALAEVLERQLVFPALAARVRRWIGRVGR